MAKNNGKNESNAAEMAVIGATLAGMAATAYFFFGPKGKKHQAQARSWAIKMKADVVEKLEKAREVSEPIYNDIIDTVAEKYAKGMKADAVDIEDLAKDLKKHWKTLTASARGKKGAKKAAKKAKK